MARLIIPEDFTSQVTLLTNIVAENTSLDSKPQSGKTISENISYLMDKTKLIMCLEILAQLKQWARRISNIRLWVKNTYKRMAKPITRSGERTIKGLAKKLVDPNATSTFIFLLIFSNKMDVINLATGISMNF